MYRPRNNSWWWSTLAATLLSSYALADEFQRGLVAFNDGNYEQAMEAWLPLAESGDLNAMYNVGLLYDEGLGVEQDKERALAWYLVPAQEGDVSAQFNVAMIYDFGDGDPADWCTSGGDE